MLRSLIILTIIFCSQGLLGQNDTINQKDANGQKQGLWVFYGRDRPPAGYPPDSKISEGVYRDDRKEGVWIRYWEDGETPKLIGTYKNNRPNGKYWKFRRNGLLREQGGFRRNVYNDQRIVYNEQGQLISRTSYNDKGHVIDSSFLYFDNGCLEVIDVMDSSGSLLKTIVYYADSCNKIKEVVNDRGIHNGQSINHKAVQFTESEQSTTQFVVNPNYHDKGSWREDEPYRYSYSDSSICSEQIEIRKLNENSDLIFQGKCENGKVMKGKFYFYDEDGILLRVEIWKNGKYHTIGQM